MREVENIALLALSYVEQQMLALLTNFKIR